MRIFWFPIAIFASVLLQTPAFAQTGTANPSLDCTRTRSTVSKVLCTDDKAAEADWQLNTAIWALYFSYDEQGQNDLNREQNTWRATLEPRCNIPAEGTIVSRASVNCLVNAYRKQAELYRSRLKGDALAEAHSSLDERMAIQRQLIQRNLLFDTVDGQFGQKTRTAIMQFQAMSGATPTGFLSRDQKRQLLSSATAPSFVNVFGSLLGVPQVRPEPSIPRFEPVQERPLVIDESPVPPMVVSPKPREQLPLPVPSASEPGKRIALVVGNSNYNKVPALPNPTRDADMVGQLFQSAGFSVRVLHNLNNAQLRRALNDFKIASSDADIAVVFFAGHGIEIENKNYLIPIDAELARDTDVRDEALELERVIDAISGAKRLRLVLLDACRNNPFDRTMKRTVLRRSISRGLAALDGELPSATLISYAAKAGSTAEDGSSTNSPFTLALRDHLFTPGLDVQLALRRVRDEVLKTTGKKQEPYFYGSLGGAEVALVERAIHVENKAQGNQGPVAPANSINVRLSEANQIWMAIKDTQNPDLLDPFIAQYGDTIYGEFAKRHQKELRERRAARDFAATGAPSSTRVSSPDTVKPESPRNPSVSGIPNICRAKPDMGEPAVVGGPFNPVLLRPILSAAREFRSIAVAPDGSVIATGGDDSTVRLWDASSLTLLAELSGHGREVYSVAFSPTGRLFASASLDGIVRVWKTATRELVYAFKAENENGPVPQYSVSFFPGRDERYVDSAGEDGHVYIWNLHTGGLDRKRNSHADAANKVTRSLAFAPAATGEFATAGYDGTLKYFLSNGLVESVRAGDGKVLQIAYSPSGEFVVSAGAERTLSSVKLWSAKTRTLVRALEGHRDYTVSVGWSKDGRLVAAGGGGKDRSIRIWDAQTGQFLKMLNGHASDVEAVAFYPDGRKLVSVSEDKSIKLWDVRSGREIVSVSAWRGSDYLASTSVGCYSGTAGAMQFLKFILLEDKIERDVTNTVKGQFYLPQTVFKQLVTELAAQ